MRELNGSSAHCGALSLLRTISRSFSTVFSPKDAPDIFRIPSDWVNTPHLRIKHDNDDNKFYLASFGEKTLVNEIEVSASDISNPSWVPLPLNSRIVLNGIVGVNIFKS